MARQKPVLQDRPISGAYFQHGICVLESHHSSQFFMAWTKGRDFAVLYILNGAGRLRMKTGEYPMRKGNVLILPRKTLYRIVDNPGAPLSIWLLGIHNPEIETWCRLAGIETCHRSTNPVVSSLVQNLFKKLLYENTIRRAAWELVMVSLALEMLGILIREKSEIKDPYKGGQDRPSLSRARVVGHVRDISENFYRPKNLEEAAASTGLGVRRFGILFRETTGMSWRAFLQDKRIQYAKKLLGETEHSIVSICFECGFHELSTFYRCFKQQENTSPKKWRETMADPATRKCRK